MRNPDLALTAGLVLLLCAAGPKAEAKIKKSRPIKRPAAAAAKATNPPPTPAPDNQGFRPFRQRMMLQHVAPDPLFQWGFQMLENQRQANDQPIRLQPPAAQWAQQPPQGSNQPSTSQLIKQPGQTKRSAAYG